MLENGNVIIRWEWALNNVLSNHVNLADELDAFVAVSTNDPKLKDLITKTISDHLISKVVWVDTYTELSEVLDTINTHIQTYTETGFDMKSLSIIIGIQEKNILYFSKTGKASVFLIKQNSEVIELTDVKEVPNNFVYISNGNLKSGEIVILSTTRVLNHLTNTEILESTSLDTISDQNQNMKEIIDEEKIGKDIAITTFRYSFLTDENTGNILSQAWDFWNSALEKIGDTLLAKRLLAIASKLKDFLRIPKAIPKNLLLFAGVFLCFFVLYNLSSSLFTSTDKIAVDDYKINLEEAKLYVTNAAENINNDDVFVMNLKKAEDLVDGIQDKQLFLWDIDKILRDINALRKQFNQVDTYNFNEDKLVIGSTTNVVKMIGLANKVYLVEENRVIWPIVTGIEPKIYNFDFSEDDKFIDAVEFWNKIILLTDKNRVVSFTSAGTFSYSSVSWQDSWQESSKIGTYGSNIYLLDGKQPQIFKHRASGNNFDTWESYFKEEDVQAFWEVLTMAIDGWFYILKKDLSMIKFFAWPAYRIESLSLNNLPKNYDHDGQSSVFLTTRTDLKYIYMYLNQKIWIFEPNTSNYINTKSLTYVGQIEWWNEEMTWFYVKADGNIFVSNKNGIYELDFQISDGKLIVQ